MKIKAVSRLTSPLNILNKLNKIKLTASSIHVIDVKTMISTSYKNSDASYPLTMYKYVYVSNKILILNKKKLFEVFGNIVGQSTKSKYIYIKSFICMLIKFFKQSRSKNFNYDRIQKLGHPQVTISHVTYTITNNR